MRVIGVIDLKRGRAVHGRGGRRDEYRPVEAAAGVPIDGDALALAHAYVALGVTGLYVADLDAIGGSSPQSALLGAIAGVGLPTWVDAAIASRGAAAAVLALGAAQVVVGLETLSTFSDLEQICAASGGDRVAFSLDLRDGAPVTCEASTVEPGSPASLAARAARAGARTIIVLDLARVGMRGGLDADLLAQVREAAPDVALFAGGGVRGHDDLERLAAAGCDGALVATALQDGRLRLRQGNVRR